MSSAWVDLLLAIYHLLGDIAGLVSVTFVMALVLSLFLPSPKLFNAIARFLYRQRSSLALRQRTRR